VAFAICLVDSVAPDNVISCGKRMARVRNACPVSKRLGRCDSEPNRFYSTNSHFPPARRGQPYSFAWWEVDADF
jgi:hypothetical protein